MADLKLTSAHDIDFNNFILTNEQGESTAQRLKIRLLRYFNEYYFNASLGIDYFGVILKKGTSKEFIDTIFIEEILNTEGVATLDIYESTIVSGVYQASFVATDDSGVVFQFNAPPINLL